MSTVRQAPSGGPLILVTGGSGIVGRNLVRRLLAEGFGVPVFARHPERLDEPWAERAAGDVQEATGVALAMVLGAQLPCRDQPPSSGDAG